MKSKILILLMSTLCLHVAFSAQAVTVREIEEAGLSLLEIENAHFSVRFAPASGGRITSWTDKKSGIEQVLWSAGGMLDDKAGLTTAPYTLRIEKRGPESAVLQLDSPTDRALHVSKRIEIRDDEPALRVRYTFTNRGDAVFNGRHMVRNLYQPGGKIGPEDHYFWNGHRGPEEHAFPYAKPDGWHEVAQPWSALIDTERKLGLAIVIDSPALSRIYNWTPGDRPDPTMEWEISLNLQPGESLTVPVTLALLRGLTGVTHADGQRVLNLQTSVQDTTLRIAAQAYAIESPEDPLVLRMRYETLDRVYVWEEDAMRFDPFPAGEMREGGTTFQAPRKGTYVAMVTTRSGAGPVGRFEFPVGVGEPSGSYFKGHRETESANELVVLTDRDLERGYVLHWGQRTPPFHPAGPVDLVLGADEYEALELGVLALADLGAVKLSVESNETIPEGAIALHTVQGVSGLGVRREWRDYGLVPGDALPMVRGEHKSFWVLINTHLLPKGRHAFRLRIDPEQAAQRVIPVVIEVLDVRRPPEEDLTFVLYHFDARLQPDPERYEQHLRLMRRSYQRLLMIDHDFPRHRQTVRVHRDESGEIAYDFTAMDTVILPAVSNGFDIVAWMSPSSSHKGLWRDSWLDEELRQLPEEELLPIREETARRMFQHFLDVGFEEVWIYIIDEPAPEQAMDPEFVATCRAYREKYPMLRFHIAMNRYAPEMANLLNPYIDIWTGDQGILAQMRRDIRDGTIRIDPADRLGFYGGSFFFHDPNTRGSAWLAAQHATTHYSMFAYSSHYSEERPWVLYTHGPDGEIVSTPPLEGLRDGYEDFAYWHTLDRLVAQVAAEPAAQWSDDQKQQIEAARTLRFRVFEETEEPLMPYRMVPGSEHRGFGAYRGPAGDRWLQRDLHGRVLRASDALQKLLAEPGKN